MDESEMKVEARRAFLKNCAKFAATMPPAITLLVSSTSGALGDPNCSHICNDTEGKPPQCDCDVEDTGNLDPTLFQEPLQPIDPELLNQGQ